MNGERLPNIALQADRRLALLAFRPLIVGVRRRIGTTDR
jgi:hypothetical protein